LISAFPKNELSPEIISFVDSWIILPPNVRRAMRITTIMDMLNGLGSFFLFSHLIKGKNSRAMNMDEIKGIKIKERIFNK
jgi:hypothetical protein